MTIQPEPKPRPQSGSRRAVVSLLAAVIAQLALIGCFTSAMSNPTLHGAPLAVVLEPGAPLADTQVAFTPAGAISARRFDSPDAAGAATIRGDVAGALIVAPDGETLLVAGASTPVLVGAVTQTVQAQARVAGLSLRVNDVRPLPANDPRALGTFLLTIGWVIGGYLGVMLLSRALGATIRTLRGTLRLLGWLLGYAVASAALAVVLVDPLMGVVTGHGWQLVIAGTLVVFTVASFTAALISVLGMPGLILAIATLVILGNPTSGGSVPDEMLAGGWRFLARILPTNAAVRLVRYVQYFDTHHAGAPGLALGVLSVAAVGVLVIVAAMRDRRGRSATTAAVAPGDPDDLAAPLAKA